MNSRIKAANKWCNAISHAKDINNEAADIIRYEGFKTLLIVMKCRIFALISYMLRKSISRFHFSSKLVSKDGISNDNSTVMQGVLFIGYVEAGLGIGSSLRGLIDSISAKAISYAIYPFNVNVETRYIGPFHQESYDFKNRYQVNVIEVATDQLPIVQQHLGKSHFSSSYNILRTYWELPQAPIEWMPILETIDEIWVANSFIADAFRSVFSRTITIVPPCVEVDSSLDCCRKDFGMQEGVFYFLFSFDYFSFPTRKNPIAVIRAFQSAFPSGVGNVGLIIKSTGANRNFEDFKVIIREASRRDPRIMIMDRTLTQQEIHSLIASCDSYISLHRSEGFGLGMAEAMAYEKPVIGTDFSGSTDFLSETTGFPISCRLRPVRRGEYPFRLGQVWAEPDIQSAAAAMREVASSQEHVRSRTRAGKALVRSRYSKSKVGTTVENRINMLLNERANILR